MIGQRKSKTIIFTSKKREFMKHQSNTCRLLLLLSLPALAMEETPRVTINERIFINSNRNELWEVEETQYIITEIFNHTGKWIGYAAARKKCQTILKISM